MLNGRRTHVFRADRLQIRREQIGLSRREFSKRVGLQEANYGRFELGNSEPSPIVLVRIAKLLGCSTDWLLGATDRPDVLQE